MDRPKWLTSDNDVKVGGVVLFLKSEKEFESKFQYAMIHAVNVRKDGHIRKVEVEYKNHNEGVKRYTVRGVRELIMVHSVDEPRINAQLAEFTQGFKEDLCSRDEFRNRRIYIKKKRIPVDSVLVR